MAKREFFVHIETDLDEDGELNIRDILEILRNLRKSDILDFYDSSDVTVKPV